jgi:hypothetical protein
VQSVDSGRLGGPVDADRPGELEQDERWEAVG